MAKKSHKNDSRLSQPDKRSKCLTLPSSQSGMRLRSSRVLLEARGQASQGWASQPGRGQPAWAGPASQGRASLPEISRQTSPGQFEFFRPWYGEFWRRNVVIFVKLSSKTGPATERKNSARGPPRSPKSRKS